MTGSYRGERAGAPTIGDRIFIGAGAKIFGRISIGNDAAIGSNCVVTRDVPDRAVVVGVPLIWLGLNFATQLARRDILDEETYKAFGAAYDLPVLEALRPKSGLVLLHLHGLQPMFELAGRYPIDVVNWHDRETAPSLAEGLAMLRYGAVSGGLDHSGPIHRGSPEDAAAQVRAAVREAGPCR